MSAKSDLYDDTPFDEMERLQVYVPPEVKEKILEYKNKSRIVTEALVQFFDIKGKKRKR